MADITQSETTSYIANWGNVTFWPTPCNPCGNPILWSTPTLNISNDVTVNVTGTWTNTTNGNTASALDNSFGGTLNVGQGAIINDAGGFDNVSYAHSYGTFPYSGYFSCCHYISSTANFAGGGQLNVGSTAWNAIDNWLGTINAGSGEIITDAGGLENGVYGVLTLNGATANVAGTVENNTFDGITPCAQIQGMAPGSLSEINLDNGATLSASVFDGSNGIVAFGGTGNNLTVNSGANLGTVTGFASGDQIDLTGTTYSNADSLQNNGSVVSVVNNGQTLSTFTISPGESFALTAGTNDQVNIVAAGGSNVIGHIGSISQSLTVAGVANTGSFISLGQDVTLGVTGTGLEAINNSGPNNGHIINAGTGAAINDAGGFDNSNYGTLSLAGLGTITVNSTDGVNALNNQNYGTIIAGSDESISVAGGLNNSNNGYISLAGYSTPPSGTGSLNGFADLTVGTSGSPANINNNHGTLVAGSGEVINDLGAVNNATGTIDLSGAVLETSQGVNNSAGGIINLSNDAGLLTSNFNGNGGTVNFGSGGNFLFVDPGQNLGTISGFSSSDGIDLTGTTYSSSSDTLINNNGVVTVANGSDVLATFTVTSGESFSLGRGPTGNVEIICFLAGTRIATPAGEAEVQTLRAGDLVLNAKGEAKPVRWVGQSTVATRFADPLRSNPIRISAGALGENLPARDLLVSPAHAIFVNGVLVQAGAMVNGTTIRRETMTEERFTYYHVELEAHELILAEGAACESFVDNIDRMNFDNWADRDASELPAPIVEMSYPRAKSARQVPYAIRQSLAARAAVLAPIANVA